MNEIQFQKPHTNIFAFVRMDGDEGKLLFKGEMVEYNPETEVNRLINNFAFTLDEFAHWLKRENMKVC